MKTRILFIFILMVLVIGLVPLASQKYVNAAEDKDCFDCHDDKGLETERNGQTISLYVDKDAFSKSIHADNGCVSCHVDADVADFPHPDHLEKVDCGLCHDDVKARYDKSTHGKATAKGNKKAPTCIECHGKHDIHASSEETAKTNKKNLVSLCGSCHKDDQKQFETSLHGLALKSGEGNAPNCVTCHTSHDILSPKEKTSVTFMKNIPVLCGKCHEKLTDQFNKSLHGQALMHDKYLAPNCTTCHERHNILPPTDERSSTYVMNIPLICGKCHKEGTPVSQLKNVAQSHVLEDYSESIHGDGLYKRGLIVSAVCTSCHTSHNILPHENKESSINRDNVSHTCMQCHRQIENVHTKVINGELWEKKPHEIPVCIDCHPPHKVRRVFYEERSFPDEMCMKCHGKTDLHKIVNGEKVSLFVDAIKLRESVHNENSCIKCHTNVDINKNPVCQGSGKVDCSKCHSEKVVDYLESQHGKLYGQGNANAPYCIDCHGTHEMMSKRNINSKTFVRNIPDLCGECHRENQKADVMYKGTEKKIVSNYTMSIHGKGLLESGLIVTATCVDCHTSHKELPASDPNSSVNHNNVASTCAKCHLGIAEKFKNSIHSPAVTKTDKELPSCKDCHKSHEINRVDLENFRKNIMDQCGRCHLEVTHTYFDTFHGKVSKLGNVRTAKCHDCHGSHNILPPSYTASTLNREHIVETCKTCHPNSNHKFVGYLTHATHHNRDKYPYLFYSFWFMTLLLVGTFLFFGAHTLLWLPRALKEKLVHKHEAPVTLPDVKYYLRFDSYSRFLHLLVIISFLSLAITGMTIKFSDYGIFQMLSHILGGYEVTGFIHRFAALITFLYFGLHIGYLIHKNLKLKMPLKDMLYGDFSMVPRWQDAIEFFQTIKWFIGKGPKPKYGRWTYWEKFDYFAVFWGVGVIGVSGLALWFPEFFTGVLRIPGWVINVATIVHSDEALLATGFIFTIHFFNTHFRPDKFPMDTVIFSGRVTLEELKEERPFEYEAMVRTNQLEKRLVPPTSEALVLAGRIFGFSALAIGITTILIIIYSTFVYYR